MLVKVLAFFLGILRIDKRSCIGYTEAREKNQTQITVTKTGMKGLIPMAFGDNPPNQQNRIDAERNESKGLVN